MSMKKKIFTDVYILSKCQFSRGVVYEYELIHSRAGGEERCIMGCGWSQNDSGGVYV